MIFGIELDFMACELCGTTIPVRRKYEQIVNVNLSRTAASLIFQCAFCNKSEHRNSNQTFMFSFYNPLKYRSN